MSLLGRAGGISIAVLLITGVIVTTYAGSIQNVDMGITFIISALMLIFIATLAYHQTAGWTLPLKTPNRKEMFIFFNVALLCLVVGEIVYRQIEFTRGNYSSWPVTVGVPVFDSINGYLVVVIPVNYIVYLLLKPYVQGTNISTLREKGRRLNRLRLVIYGTLLILATLGVIAAFAESDFMYIPSMVFSWLFAFMLFAGVTRRAVSHGRKAGQAE